VTADQSTSRAADTQTRPDIVVVQSPNSRPAQAYRTARASIRNAASSVPIRSVLLVEAGVGDQAGLAAANVAASFALNGDPTVLIDCDTLRPAQHEIFGVPAAPGLVAWLNESHTSPAFVETGVPRLDVLPAGDIRQSPDYAAADLLTVERCDALISAANDRATMIIFNAPALPDASEALTIAARVDAVLLVVRSGVTNRAAAQGAKESLDRVGANILGVVLTDV
jgi:capsular exopolysaccharide synthesis family protein